MLINSSLSEGKITAGLIYESSLEMIYDFSWEWSATLTSYQSLALVSLEQKNDAAGVEKDGATCANK